MTRRAIRPLALALVQTVKVKDQLVQTIEWKQTNGQTDTTDFSTFPEGGSVAEWLACWNQAQKGLGSNRSRDAVG